MIIRAVKVKNIAFLVNAKLLFVSEAFLGRGRIDERDLDWIELGPLLQGLIPELFLFSLLKVYESRKGFDKYSWDESLKFRVVSALNVVVKV